MLTVVLVVNLLIGLSCLIAAWYLWILKCRLTRFADQLIAAERAVHRVLYPAPRYIRMGQTSTSNLRLTLEGLEPQLQRIQRIMSLISFSQVIWRRYFVLSPVSKGGIGDRDRFDNRHRRSK